MKWLELIKACAKGRLPKVKTGTGLVGQVSVIKDNGRHKGIGVVFPGLEYDTWFNDSEETDKRSRYMRELVIVDDPTPSSTEVLRIWNLAMTIANNECVRWSDEFNNGDHIEKADAADRCAKTIRGYIDNIIPEALSSSTQREETKQEDQDGVWIGVHDDVNEANGSGVAFPYGILQEKYTITRK